MTLCLSEESSMVGLAKSAILNWMKQFEVPTAVVIEVLSSGTKRIVVW
jgi:hypothetical protein